jgi:hypothetical protein
MRRILLVLFIALLAGAAPSCNALNAFGNLWSSSTCNGAGGGGAGGDGAGGDGAGGDDEGGDPGEGVGVGAADVGVGVGAGVGGGSSEERRPRRHAHRHAQRRPRGNSYYYPGLGSGLGVAVQADCPQMGAMQPTGPVKQGLTTQKLRAIAAAVGIGKGLTGIQLSQKIGLAFQDWVLYMHMLPQWKQPILSPERQNQNKGLPASVVPDSLTDVTLYSTETGLMVFPLSEFWEMKAVNGTLFLSTSQYQILGLLNVAQISLAGTSTLPQHPPPVVAFTTTFNTNISPSVLARATQWGVAVWQEVVYYDASDTTGNPDLYLGPIGPMNDAVYPPNVNIVPQYLNTKPAKLTDAQPGLAVPVPANPDPPTVD